MTTEIIMVFAILLITVILFAFEVFPVDKIAFFIIVSLTLLGLITPEESLMGFANPATITVLALMMLAIATEQNGVISWMVSGLGKVKSQPLYIIAPIFMMVTAGISAFISTTAVVIVFIKIITRLSEKFKISQSKLLLPISFAGILGGSCTLMGTSTNLIVNSVSQKLGAEKLGFFEFALFGVIFLSVSIVFLTVAIRWLPKDRHHSLNADYGLDKYITSVVINEDSHLVGKTIIETFLYDNTDISLLKLTRNNRVHSVPGKYVTLKANDELLLSCDIENLTKLVESEHLTVHDTQHFETELEPVVKEQPDEASAAIGDRIFVELMLLPGSTLLGRTLGYLRQNMFQDTVPIAIKKRKTLSQSKDRFVRSSKDKLTLKPGDRLLVEVDRDNVQSLQALENVAIFKEFEVSNPASKFKRYFSLAVLLGVIVLAASGALSILVSSLTGVCVLLLSNTLHLNEVYKKVNWQIIFLLAGMIPLGIAMTNTGADGWISNQLLGFLQGKPEMLTIGVLFFVTMILSGIVSNNATAIIMTPIAMAVAKGMNMDYKPFILAVMFAANFSFFTPIGYQTNTLIYGLGHYKFKHFFIIGGMLSVILLVLATFLLTTLL